MQCWHTITAPLHAPPPGFKPVPTCLHALQFTVPCIGLAVEFHRIIATLKPHTSALFIGILCYRPTTDALAYVDYRQTWRSNCNQRWLHKAWLKWVRIQMQCSGFFCLFVFLYRKLCIVFPAKVVAAWSWINTNILYKIHLSLWLQCKKVKTPQSNSRKLDTISSFVSLISTWPYGSNPACSIALKIYSKKIINFMVPWQVATLLLRRINYYLEFICI